MNQEYVYNEKAAVYNCNVCNDVKIVMTGLGEQPPEGCTDPECESNQGKTPTPGLQVKYVEYGKKESVKEVSDKNKYCPICGELIKYDCPGCQTNRLCTDCNGTGYIIEPCYHINPLIDDNGSRTIDFIHTWMVR